MTAEVTQPGHAEVVSARRDDAGAMPTNPELESMYPGLRRFAACVGDWDMDPDDLVQDALTALFARRRDVANVEAYLRTTIVRRVTYLRRAAARDRARGRVDVAGSAGPGGSEDPGSAVELTDLVSVLSPIDRALVLLVDVDGTPASAAAAELGLTHVAARARLSRARARLRRHLAEEGDGDGSI